jgi:hypothetical protein
MKVREAVAAAKGHIQELFADEQIANLGLEEVEFDEATGTWTVTLGFSRPWDKPVGPFANLAPLELRPWRRDYKIIQISDATGNLISIKNRESPDVC